MRRFNRRLNRFAAIVIIACNIGQTRSKTAPAAPVLALWPDDPTAQLNRFIAGKFSCKGGIGSVENVVAFVKDNARRALGMIAASCCIDHHQGMVGNNQIGLSRSASRALDKALLVMRASGINAFTALIGEGSNCALAKERSEPSGQIAADHIAIAAKRGPASDQMRKDSRPASKAALKRVF